MNKIFSKANLINAMWKTIDQSLTILGYSSIAYISFLSCLSTADASPIFPDAPSDSIFPLPFCMLDENWAEKLQKFCNNGRINFKTPGMTLCNAYASCNNEYWSARDITLKDCESIEKFCVQRNGKSLKDAGMLICSLLGCFPSVSKFDPCNVLYHSNQKKVPELHFQNP